jgi:hypothetical protein
VGRGIRRFLKLPRLRLAPGGYRIEKTTGRKGHLLLVTAGDRFGLLCGLADVCDRSRTEKSTLTYWGGERTEIPAFPLRFFWVWDHRLNWVLDDAGAQISGCFNPYLKRPETYVEECRRLIDHCIDMRVNGLVIWGFLRDVHGGVSAAQEVARYAGERGVSLLPGVGTTGYGGVYYEGDHPCNIETYLQRHPERGNVRADKSVSRRELSPYHPENLVWSRDALEWLCDRFSIGGVNLENMDFMVDHSRRARLARARMRTGESDFFKDQYHAYRIALETLDKLRPDGWNLYATYADFARFHPSYPQGRQKVPYFAAHLPRSAVAQWTLTKMLRSEPLPLSAWLDDPSPAGLYDNPLWPRGLRPPTPRSAGFLHQGSHIVEGRCRRAGLCLSTFMEACKRGYEAGLEGLGVFGEVCDRPLSWKLNYRAIRHFTYHPGSSLRDFAQAEVRPIFQGNEHETNRFIELLCAVEGGDYEAVFRQDYGGEWIPQNYPPRGNLAAFRLYEEIAEWCRQGKIAGGIPFSLNSII